MTALTTERIRWLLRPGQREYITDLLIEIRIHVRELDFGLQRNELLELEQDLVSLLPEVQFDSADEPTLMHPSGSYWKPKINRKPKALIFYVCRLEEISDRYRPVRWRHNLDVDLQERES